MNHHEARAIIASVIDATADEFVMATFVVDDFPTVALMSLWAVVTAMVEMEIPMDSAVIREVNAMAGWTDMTTDEIDEELLACLSMVTT
jgi:cbb3-type cytochrome oxidase subunit 1